MSNEYPGDEPTRAYRPDEGAYRPAQRAYSDQDATRLERPVPGYDPNREPAYNPYPAAPVVEDRRGIAAQLVLTSLVSIIVGLILGYFLFRGLGSSTNASNTSTTTSLVTTSTTAATTTTSEETTTTRKATTTTTTTRPSTTSATSRSLVTNTTISTN